MPRWRSVSDKPCYLLHSRFWLCRTTGSLEFLLCRDQTAKYLCLSRGSLNQIKPSLKFLNSCPELAERRCRLHLGLTHSLPSFVIHRCLGRWRQRPASGIPPHVVLTEFLSWSFCWRLWGFLRCSVSCLLLWQLGIQWAMHFLFVFLSGQTIRPVM